MKLIIAEKPSVAQTIAKILGVTTKKEGYIEGNDYIIFWCVGHLVTLADTQIYDEKYLKWNFEDLPILPKPFQYQVAKGKEKQLKIVTTLLNRKDIEYVVNGCDAGREGELIFQLVYDYAKSSLPIKRLWISSMEDTAIKEGFAHLKDGADMKYLYQSALSRLHSDWLVGINATRLYSSIYKKTLQIGRVMTPTLHMIVFRHHNIQMFQPEDFYTISLEQEQLSFSSERFLDKNMATSLLNDCKNHTFIVENIETNEKIEKPPTLYDLTTLQREANKQLGFTASQTLDFAQSLYEKKLITYPRTDSKFLTNDMEASLIPLCDQVISFLQYEPTKYNTHLVINNKKVSDHTAIIPTQGIKKIDILSLSNGENLILKMISQKLLSAVSDNFEYQETIIQTKYNNIFFSAKGKTIIKEGFKIYQPTNTKKEASLPTVNIGDTLQISPILKKGQTSSPKEFTEDTLLSAMEQSGKKENVEKEFCGIGTPATRASIIEKLVSIGMIERKGNKKTQYLLPTQLGTDLISILPDKLTSPILTAELEEKLSFIEQNKFSYDDFMENIVVLIHSLIEHFEHLKKEKNINPLLFLDNKKIVGKCPRCGFDMINTKKAYSCISCECAIWKENKFFLSQGKTLTEKIVVELLSNGKADMKGFVSQKTGKKYMMQLFYLKILEVNF